MYFSRKKNVFLYLIFSFIKFHESRSYLSKIKIFPFKNRLQNIQIKQLQHHYRLEALKHKIINLLTIYLQSVN
jgi:hypothetical protein